MSENIGYQRRPEFAGSQTIPATVFRVWQRRTVCGPFVVSGALSVIVGGLLAAAIAAPAPTRHGVWAVAYLVLVLGVGQIVLGVGQALLASVPPPVSRAVLTAAAFNGANVAVVVGVVTDRLVVFDAGAVLLAAVLAMFLYEVRHGARCWPLYAYRLFVAALLVSIPIGLLLTTAGAR